MLRDVLVIAGKDLRQRMRDRSALVLGFVAPVAMVALMSVAFAGTGDLNARIAVVDRDGGPAAEALLDAFDSPELEDLVDVTRVDDTEAAREAVLDGDADAALVVPDGLSAMAAGGEPVAVEVLSSVDGGISGDIAQGIATAFTSRIATARLVSTVAAELNVPVDRVVELSTEAATADAAVAAVREPVGSEPLDLMAYFGPAMGMYFVLLAVGFTVQGFFLEREIGTIDRMGAAPIRPEAVLVGKGLSVFAYSVASLSAMAVITALVFDAPWGPPLGVAALIVAMGAAVVALTMLVMAVARTPRQAEGMSSLVTFGLALLGGSFMFIGESPPIMRQLAVLTPNGWALRGLTDLATGVDVWTAVARPLGGIAAFTALVAVAALALGRRGWAR